nr:DNA-3-methyladenine glycosylase 2 family protein [Candidatus Woesebacteria bacterium]
TEYLFVDIVSSIVGQQLSVKAADTIWKRFETLFSEKKVTPEAVLLLSDQEIRDVGCSFSKIKYMKGLAQLVVEKKIDLSGLLSLNDEEVITELTKVKGIGRWTAEMILIFSLARPDVFSLGDLGLKTAVSRLYSVDREDLKKIEEISLKWSPNRSLASRYLWRSLDNEKKVKLA